MHPPSNILRHSFSPIQRIVLVEDSAIIRESLLEALGSAGSERLVIGTAETEDDAFRFMSCHATDAAIIDINLRQGSGIGLLTRLLGLGGAPRLRIVYTNHYSRRIHEHCSQLGATHVLSKAGNVSELLEVLEEGNVRAQ